MLDKSSWLPQAQALALGGRTRTGHACGPGSVLMVEHTQEGWRAWCHRCADSGWHPKPLPTLAERNAARAAQQAQEAQLRRDPRPPYPVESDVHQWPLEARVWLFKAGLFYDDIAALGAYYHPGSRRVVLPVVDDGRLVYWQARNVGLCPPDSPKYLNPLVDRSTVVARYGKDSRCLVLTEDILSAYRVGLCSEGWAVLGTRLPDPMLSRIIAENKPVLVWMDNDPTPENAGQKAAHTILKQLALVGVPAANIVTDIDAKALSRRQVHETITDSLRAAAW